ncbi:bifunctional adenosylcobinamide kinase/adenosylcobinamide-phosphate guanylyltransferase [Dehalobacter sp. DCM]|uniref:bifunctional adenosylcobinamide kinase/adenosylcobinamide-phosphate guanylyltransferase n=1 Tax=Dehalobacter sp. DCM TaxID=2907827 RepID=UPI0030821859|nr:bifunctional adenosylcobinamide kinase/adenosylcobinamide-phosphate guanylyltransferase [Dehalobacter sp. DCM]
MIALVSGGVASGKSAMAENLAVNLNKGRIAYIATMTVSDDECRNRVVKHRLMRHGKGFDTFELAYHLAESPSQFVGIDCALLEDLGNLIANEMYFQRLNAKQAFDRISSDIQTLAQIIPNLVIVTNTIFSDITDYDPFTMDYISVLGQLNTMIGTNADIVLEAVCSIPVIHKGKKDLPHVKDLI